MTSEVEVGFKETTSTEVLRQEKYQLVPWISWDDWCFVKDSLFSSSPDPAFRRISAWRSRGCLPVIIEVTASIVEVQRKDPHFREGLSPSDLLEDDMLTMLYCMTIMRLINGIVEKTRDKNKFSIAEVADVIGIPRMLIDIRHESSHRDLPSLKLVRHASTKALDWLKAYYWEPQKMAILYPSDKTANCIKEIKSRIRKLASSMDVKGVKRSGFSLRGKSLKEYKSKQSKNVLKLYSSFPSEVVSILLDFLLKAQKSAHLMELSDSSQAKNFEADTTQLDDWKPLVMKLSNKEPEMLLSLLKAVVQLIETRETLKEGEHLKPEHNPGLHQTEHLSSLFQWLVGNLMDLKYSHQKSTSIEAVSSPKEKVLSKSDLVQILRKCLTVSSLGNNYLATAVSVLAQRTGNHTFVQKLNKLASLQTPYVDTMNETISIDQESFYNQQEKFINQAAKKLEFFKQKLSQKHKLETVGVTKKKSKRWSVVKSWKSCPIGMLPSDIDSSGVFPILDVVDDQDEQANLEERCEKLVVNESRGKREADCPLDALDNSNVKKCKENECIEDDERTLEEVNNRLMIDGVWKRVTEDELSNIASSIRILV
uniref:pre-rRNA-processing protein las1 n=1 Tax=Erigeron canadensis TaxID=72917 RepID=UPI001CB92937|nr:pre-rRNA-processing protein las1 [Erigeron canadensis]XP_043631891.1 pre-rRNA-processing protein las1 [Erigeron canadensis]